MKCTFASAYLLLVFLTAKSQTPASLDKDENIISGGFTFLCDTSGSLNIGDILNSSQLNRFRLADQNSLRNKCSVYWLHLVVQNHTGFDKEWIMDFMYWAYVSAYLIDQKGQIDSSHKTGHFYPYQKRDYSVGNEAYLLIPIKADSVLECFIRLQLDPLLSIRPADLDIKVRSRSLVDNENILKGKIVYIFLAVFSIMFIYHLFIYLSVRLKSYAYYLTLLFFMLYATADNSGYIVEIFGGIARFPIWIMYFDQFSSSLLGLSILLFGTHFLQVKTRYPSWNKIINSLIVLFVLAGFVGIYDGSASQVLTAISMTAVTICIIILAIKSIKDKFPSAGYFLAGYAAFLLSMLPIPLGLLQLIPLNIWTMSCSIAFGSTIEIVLFSLALADTINVLRQENYENKKKQQNLLKEQENMQFFFQQELLKTQLEIQEQTFRNISQEIHDNIGQMLSLIKVNIDHLFFNVPLMADRKLAETRNLVIKVISDVRDLSKTLNTDFISKIGLGRAIEQQLNLLKKTEQYEIRLTVDGEETECDSRTELVIFRIVQELLNNIIKHAEATAISVAINYQQEKLIIVVIDNGKGFDILEAQSMYNSLGLMNIKNRIKMINGFVSFDSQPQKGTTVLIELPR